MLHQYPLHSNYLLLCSNTVTSQRRLLRRNPNQHPNYGEYLSNIYRAFLFTLSLPMNHLAEA